MVKQDHVCPTNRCWGCNSLPGDRSLEAGNKLPHRRVFRSKTVNKAKRQSVGRLTATFLCQRPFSVVESSLILLSDRCQIIDDRVPHGGDSRSAVTTPAPGHRRIGGRHRHPPPSNTSQRYLTGDSHTGKMEMQPECSSPSFVNCLPGILPSVLPLVVANRFELRPALRLKPTP